MSNSQEQFISIQDNRSVLRRNILKRWFASNFDILRFINFLAHQTRIPIFGKMFIKPIIKTYYYNIHPNSFILPRVEIEEIIKNSYSLYVDPCVCRTLHENCDNPIYTCIRINYPAEIRQKETGQYLSKNDAITILNNARKHGVILTIEQCLRPYQYNICMCCTCCCLPKKLRYEFGVDVYRAGPYIPEIEEQECKSCKKCINKCPVSAISENNGNIEINIQECLGCGVCEDLCPSNSITMIKKRLVQIDESEPGTVNLFFKKLFIVLGMAPMVFLYKLINKNQQYKVENPEPRKKDVYGRQGIIIEK